MPSVDPKTGKRLHGSAQRRQAALRRGAEVPSTTTSPEALVLAASRSSIFLDLPTPPHADGPAATARWATRLLGLCVQALSDERDVGRAMLLQRGCKLLGRLQPRAQRSFDACTLRRLRLGRGVDLATEQPPDGDDLAAHAWAAARLASLLHRAATDPVLADEAEPREAAAAAAGYWRVLDALGGYEKLSVDAAVEELRRELEAAEA